MQVIVFVYYKQLRENVFVYFQLVIAVNNLNQEKVEKSKLLDENKFLRAALEDKNKEVDEVTKKSDEYKWDLFCAKIWERH